jgi:hypothetical protein
MVISSSALVFGGACGSSWSFGIISGLSRYFTSSRLQFAVASTNQIPSPVQSTSGSPFHMYIYITVKELETQSINLELIENAYS